MADRDYEDNGYTDEESADSSGNGVANAEPTAEQQRLAELRQAVREELVYSDRRFQAFADRTSSAIATIQQQVSTLAARGFDTGAIQEIIDDGLAQIRDLQLGDPDEAERKRLQRDNERLKRRADSASADAVRIQQERQQQSTPGSTMLSEADFQIEFGSFALGSQMPTNGVVPDMVDFAANVGLDPNALLQAWDALAAQAAPNGVERSTRGLRDFRRNMQGVIRAYAKAQADGRRAQTRTPQVRGTSAGPSGNGTVKDWGAAQKVKSLEEFTDDEYWKLLGE